MVVLAKQQETHPANNLFWVLKALEATQMKPISQKQAALIHTILLILDSLLPNQTWETKLEFLEMVSKSCLNV